MSGTACPWSLVPGPWSRVCHPPAGSLKVSKQTHPTFETSFIFQRFHIHEYLKLKLSKLYRLPPKKHLIINFVLLSVSYLSCHHLHIKYLCRNLVVAQQPQGRRSSERRSSRRNAQTRNTFVVHPAGMSRSSRSEEPPHHQPLIPSTTRLCLRRSGGQRP